MNFDPNDPRWSTLILDPDSLPPDERCELTAFAETNAECGRFLGELRAAAGELEVGLRKELVTPTQWQEMEAAVKAEVGSRQVEKPVKIAEGTRGWRFTWVEGLVALALVGVTAALFLPAVQTARESSRRMATRSQSGPPLVNSTPHYRQDDIEYRTPTTEFKLADGERLQTELPYEFSEKNKVSDPLDKLADLEVASAMDVSAAKDEIVNAAPADTAPTGAALSGRTVKGPKTAVAAASTPGVRLYNGQTPLDSRVAAPIIVSGKKPAAANYTQMAAEAEYQQQKLLKHDPKQLALGETRGGEGEPEVRFSRGLNRNWSVEQSQGNSEVYPTLVENAFIKAAGQDALSTFSIDVDTASYANVRRFLTQNMAPPAGAVRVEELINYFRYDYAPPKGEHPFAVHVETAACPWEPKHRLARIALKGKVIDEDKRPASNLVFLLDVSGSMNEPNKLPLVKQSLRMLVERLTENDRVAIAVYAGNSGLVLDSTTGDKKEIILGAIDSLQPGGSTNGEAGIKLAYQQAVKGFIKGGTNRVILCTDGDFNVGVSDDTELVNIITEQAKSGVFLSVLGFGMGNYKDAKMMQLADKGNGNYAYIDTAREGRKVLVEQMSGTLITIAKDVKIQIEFNPQQVAAYRLIGYEKRMLKTEDFKDDTKDAGEIGAGHTVTALYELVPANGAVPSAVDPLIFQKTDKEPAAKPADGPKDDRAFVVKLRYKKPDGDVSTEFRTDVKDNGQAFSAASKDFQFASAVASFGMLLRNSEFKGGGNLAAVAEIAAATKGEDEGGYRQEFVDLVNAARRIQPGK